MSDVIYPALVKSLTFTSLKTSEFPSIVRKAPDGTELRIPQRKNQVWHFTFVYDYLRGNYPSPNSTMAYAPYTDLDALIGFLSVAPGTERRLPVSRSDRSRRRRLCFARGSSPPSTRFPSDTTRSSPTIRSNQTTILASGRRGI